MLRQSRKKKSSKGVSRYEKSEINSYITIGGRFEAANKLTQNSLITIRILSAVVVVAAAVAAVATVARVHFFEDIRVYNVLRKLTSLLFLNTRSNFHRD